MPTRLPLKPWEMISRHEYLRRSDQLGRVGTLKMGSERSEQPGTTGFLAFRHAEAGRNSRNSPIPAGELTAWLKEADRPPVTSAWGFTEAERQDALQSLRPTTPEPEANAPADWIVGVTKLQTMGAPAGIDERRSVRFRYDALRLLHERRAGLDALGWDAIDLFGLHRLTPDRRHTKWEWPG